MSWPRWTYIWPSRSNCTTRDQRGPRKRIVSGRRRPQAPTGANQVWSYDFVFDWCANGQCKRNGQPATKAFVLTHANIGTNVQALATEGLVAPSDRALVPLPLYHAYPYIVGMLTALQSGMAIWMRPAGPFLTLIGLSLFGLNKILMRLFFRLRVRGLEHLPLTGPLLLVANHVSDIDPLAIAASLPFNPYGQKIDPARLSGASCLANNAAGLPSLIRANLSLFPVQNSLFLRFKFPVPD